MTRSIRARTKGFTIFGVIVGLLLLVGPSQAADIKVSLDRKMVSINDSFTLIYQVTGEVDDDPDFSPLEKDFHLLSNHRRSNFTIVNGQRNSSLEWLVELKAKRQGVLTVPSVQFGADVSPAGEVTIKAAPKANDQQDGDLFVEVEAIPESTWVQGQILYTIRLFRSINTFNSSLSEPEISGGQMIVEKLEDRQFETSRGNKRFIVLERRYALFPQASGESTINPIIFKGQFSQRTRKLFDPFAQNSRTIQRESEAITLRVDAVPADYKGATWLPARKLDLSEKWMKDNLELVVGEPITRIVVIKAEGLTAEQLPELAEPGTTEIDNFKIYPDQPELSNQTNNDGVLGIRQEKSAVIPSAPGEYVLPAVRLPWWNTQTGTMEIAELPERVINVLPAAGSKPLDDQNSQVVETTEPDLTKLTAVSANNDDLQAWSGIWPWLSLILGLGWAGTLLLWWRQVHRDSVPAEEKEQLSERSSLRSLRNTVRLKDPVLVKDALLNWGKSLWQEDSLTSLTELAMRTDQSLAKEITLLNQALYGKASDNAQQWDAERLLLAVENYDGVRLQVNKSANSAKPELQPLYKIS